jgi:ADP-ribose pyrophosphatase YjhB (NUDIX family)
MASIGVFAIIFDDRQRVLCVRMNYAEYNWTTPGGRVEAGESPMAALVREVREETGFDVVPTELVGIYSKPFEDDLVLCFECQVTGRRIWSPTDEISAVEFFAQSSLPEDMTYVVRTRILDGINRERSLFRVFADASTLVGR